MCFEPLSCFGGRREDFGGERPARKPTHGRGRRGNRGNDEYYSGGGATDHKAPAAAATYDHQPYAAADEAGQKAYHDGARKDRQADIGGHGRYAAYVHDKQADAGHGMPKLPAWHNKAGDVAFPARLHEAAADRRVDAAVDYDHC